MAWLNIFRFLKSALKYMSTGCLFILAPAIKYPALDDALAQMTPTSLKGSDFLMPDRLACNWTMLHSPKKFAPITKAFCHTDSDTGVSAI
ncbi:hypothetical protein D8B22_16560 [Verminephrobacter aporrectodeae subsp. tuberculatae]|nr:hypothetical protein [Verminephrobacter aporrectodeae subsp. tuberculatae]MCW8170678.1 hypothetical protein [Verminephrobacter aporrectodeae subsp. tuberculatae]